MKKKIFIFDDDQTLLEVLDFVLRENGYEIATSETCNDIIEKVSSFNPDLIIMDNYIPDIGGVEAVQLLKSQKIFCHIRIIFATASSNVIHLKNISGADDYLRKPFDLSHLEEVLEMYL